MGMRYLIHKANVFALLLTLFIGAQAWFAMPSPALADAPVAPQAPSGTSWLEPRGINVADLVGLVPEEHLRNAIINYGGEGLAQYISGQRNGSTVTIEARMIPRFAATFTIVPCLGKAAQLDEWPSPSPAATVRLFNGGTDVTRQVALLFFGPAGLILPRYNSSAVRRYGDFSQAQVEFTGDGALVLPANMGCSIYLNGRYLNLTARFAFSDVPQIAVSPLGSETFLFQSYMGPGASGVFQALNAQMLDRYGMRHSKFQLNIPAGAEYILVKYPPTPIDPYAGSDAIKYGLAGSGSYRLARSRSPSLSVDHTNTMAIPLHGQWIDADLSAGSVFLPFFADSTTLAAPEYFLPAGIPYNSCMTYGGCSNALLDQIYNKTMEANVYYYKIERIARGLQRIPLRQVGPTGGPGDWTTSTAEVFGAPSRSLRTGGQYLAFLPLISLQLPPDDPTGCPCGWFDKYGRMVDFIPPRS